MCLVILCKHSADHFDLSCKTSWMRFKGANFTCTLVFQACTRPGQRSQRWMVTISTRFDLLSAKASTSKPPSASCRTQIKRFQLRQRCEDAAWMTGKAVSSREMGRALGKEARLRCGWDDETELTMWHRFEMSHITQCNWNKWMGPTMRKHESQCQIFIPD